MTTTMSRTAMHAATFDDQESHYSPVLVARTDDERRRIFRLRYEVYVAELGKDSRGADHAERLLVDELDDASDLLYMCHDNQVVGTMRWTPDDGGALDRLPRHCMVPRFREAVGTALSFSSRFAILPAYRRTTVSSRLILAGYERARQRGVEFDLLHTNPALVPWYERLGYKRYGSGSPTDVGLLIPMALPLSDIAYLESSGSLFYPLATCFPDATGRADWMRRTFPLLSDHYPDYPLANRPHGAREAAIDHMSVRLAQALGVDAADASRLRSAGYVHRFDDGDVVLRAGDRSTCVFIAMTGAFACATPQHGTVEIEAVGHSDIDSSSRATGMVRCCGVTTTFCIPRSHLQALCRSDEALRRDLTRALTKLSAPTPDAVPACSE